MMNCTVFIYRAPKPHSAFIVELHDLLTSLCSPSSSNIILGDMNIHIDNPSSPLAADFFHILDCLNLTQHVDAPTHTRGHTLDLVIPDCAAISHLLVYDLGVSDHSIISMEVSCLSPTSQDIICTYAIQKTLTLQSYTLTSNSWHLSTLHQSTNQSTTTITPLPPGYTRSIQNKNCVLLLYSPLVH